jgi:hypothetical protein
MRRGRREGRSQVGKRFAEIGDHFMGGSPVLASRGGFLPECGWWCKLTSMHLTKVGKLAPVTLGHMRSQGCRDLLVYCNSGRCNHRAIMNVGHLPDGTVINSLGDGIVCTRCGHFGADVVPNWPIHAAPPSY